MLSRARVKFIKSLQLKKYRIEEQCFVVEGAKSIQELLRSDFEIVLLAATGSFLATVVPFSGVKEIAEVSERELSEVSSLDTSNSGLAVVRMKVQKALPAVMPGFSIVLDGIRDPGNLGTIIRIADWYCIRNVISSTDSVDFYNPKVIQASMGSIFHLDTWSTNLEKLLGATKHPVYGAFLDGDDVHNVRFDKNGFIVIGNESNGIGPAMEAMVTCRISIPRYGQAESLNAAVATAVICDNLRRSL